jgi:hypothetical protein
MKRICCAALLLATVAVAHAEHWDWVTVSSGGLRMGDMDSVRRDGAVTKVWIHQVADLDEENNQVTRHQKQHWWAKCGEGTLALSQFVEYEDLQMTVVSDSATYKLLADDYVAPVPGTVGESIYKWACEQKWRSKKAAK